MSQPRLVRIDWEDASSDQIWRSVNKLFRAERLQVQSVGFVIRSDKKEMVLAQSLSEVDNMAGTIAIPRGCIRKVRLLRSKK